MKLQCTILDGSSEELLNKVLTNLDVFQIFVIAISLNKDWVYIFYKE